jgi:hypothetical protein
MDFARKKCLYFYIIINEIILMSLIIDDENFVLGLT